MLAVSTDDLLTIFRQEVVDPLEGISPQQPDSENLWKNAEILTYMTEAADAVARDVEGLYKILQLPVQANVQFVPLPRNVLHIREARLLTAQRRLRPKNANQVTQLPVDDYGMHLNSDFWTSTGVPNYFVRDYDRRGLLLAPIPSAVDTLELQCTTTLGAPLVAGMPLPFFEVPEQRLMLLYMKHLAYAKQDADTLDLKRSVDFKKQYDDRVVDRKELLESYRRTPGLVEVWDGPTY
jgi:hypothetical protein